MIASGTSYYYVQDPLGSVIQLVTGSGSVGAQYAYDPYGNQTTVSGTVVSDISYAGYFHHAVAGWTSPSIAPTIRPMRAGSIGIRSVRQAD